MKKYLDSVKKRFSYYKTLGEQAIEQVNDTDLFWCYNDESNSIATIVKHLAGNMLSRWTNFFNTDGEKPWRNRDAEFENDIKNRNELLQKWNEGWDCLFNALNSIKDDDWEKVILIRNEPHSLVDAINRQLSHYPYHIGQIVLLAKWPWARNGILFLSQKEIHKFTIMTNLHHRETRLLDTFAVGCCVNIYHK